MLKTATLAVLVGLSTFATVLPSNAQFIAGKKVEMHNSTNHDCAYQLNYMPHVSRAHIESIATQPVFLVPVCEDGLIGRNDDYGWLFTAGNVGTLRLPIARNAALISALKAQGYDEQDVISLRFGGGDSVMLYVHQRTLR